MTYNTKMATITVDGVTYDVQAHSIDLGERYTLTLDGEDVFKGLEGTVEYDQYDQEMFNPRDWTNVGTMSVSYRGYSLGDEDISKIDFKVNCDDCDGAGVLDRIGPVTERDDSYGIHTVDYECEKCEGTGELDINPADYFIKECGARVVIGLFVYEHSGITMSAGPRVGEVLKESDIRSSGRFIGDDVGWDTSFVGFIFDTPEGRRDCIGDNATDEEIEAALRSEVAVYASYLEGDVTQYCVEDDETNYCESCGGYVGDHKTCESEMYSAMEAAIVKRLAEGKERAEWAARDTITE